MIVPIARTIRTRAHRTRMVLAATRQTQQERLGESYTKLVVMRTYWFSK